MVQPLATEPEGPAGPSFTPIGLHRGSQEVAEQIREAIVSGQLQPGDRLEPQRQLAAQFGVSRALVNEALRVLEHSGLIETRTGAHGGSFVKVPAEDELVRHVNLLVRLGTVSVEQLTDFRLVLEGQNAAWAARRAHPHERALLNELAEAAARIARRDPDAESLDEIDAQFHIAVAVAARNGLSLAAVRGFTPPLRQLTGLVPVDQAPTAAAQFAAIAGAIEARRSGAARTHMKEHIRYFADVLASSGTSAVNWPRRQQEASVRRRTARR
jgi:GntR family transcriptional regulator, transcriptional repressor for pyruvate dehydrogenase complex